MGKRENSHMPGNIRLRRTRIVRIIAFVVAMFYLFQQIVWAQGGGTSSSAIPNSVTTAKNFCREKLPEIPYEFGETHEFSVERATDEVIFHIQDSHASLDAQYSIVELLETLVTDYDISLIALEGAEGYIDTSVLQSFPDKEIRKDTADRLMKEGLMSAAEFFTITRDEKNIDLYGIEDEELYRKNVNEFRETIEARAGAIANIDALLAQLNLLEKVICSEELRRLNHNSFEHRECEMSFSNYWQELREFTNRFRIDTGKFRELAKLVEAIKLEKGIDFPKANTERRALIDELSTLLDKTALKELVLKSVDFQKKIISPSEFHKYLLARAEKHKIPSENYPNLNMFTRYVSVYERINLPRLAIEAESLENEIRENLYRNEDERRLVEIVKMTSHLRRLYNMELTPHDYKFIENSLDAYRAGEFTAFIKSACQRYGIMISAGYDISVMFSGMKQAMEFYETAEDRNRHMLRNTVTRMKAGGKRVAALVTGGFHTEGLTKIMKEKKLSYLVIAPKFETGEERPYIAVLTGKKKPYQKLLETEKYQLAMEPFFYRSNMEKLKEKLFYALGRAVLKGDDPNEVKDIWFNAHKTKYETIFSEEQNKTKFGAITPIELKAFLDNIHVIRSGARAIIGDKTEKNSIIILARKNDVYRFKAATPEQKRKFLNRISEGEMPFSVIPEDAGIWKKEIDITGFVQERKEILIKLDGFIDEIAGEILTSFEKKKIDEDDIKKQAVTLLKRKGMPSDWEDDIGFRKRVNKIVFLVRQDIAVKKTKKEKKISGKWKKAIDVKKYWKKLKTVLGDVPENIYMEKSHFYFSHFIGKIDFFQQIIESKSLKNDITEHYGKQGDDGNEKYSIIVRRLEALRTEIFSNQNFSTLSKDVPEEIREHWSYVLNKYYGCRWFEDITEENVKIFKEILRAKITSQNKTEFEKYIECFEKSLSSETKTKVPWHILEEYTHIKILEATKYWENGVDIYRESKEKNCKGGVEFFINNVNAEKGEKVYKGASGSDTRVILKEMLDMILLGNMYSDSANKTQEERQEKYLVDDSEEALDYLFDLREKTENGKETVLHILHDNVGFELVSLFYFANFCIKNKIVKKIVLHTKNYPYCVSDVTGEKDIRMQLDALSCVSELENIPIEKSGNVEYMKRLSNDITGHLKNRNIVIAKPHWFSTLGQNFVDIPEDYYTELKKADLIVAIGDAWYRKFFLNRNWNCEAPAKKILSYMPAPTLILRIGKNPMIAGVTTKMVKYLKKIGKWWKPPKFGMIHFARGGKYARKKTDRKEYEAHEETIDEELEIAYAEGRFRAVEDKIIAPVANFFRDLGYEKISKELSINSSTSMRQITINEVTGIKNFRGHASWRGVHVNAELGGEEKQKVLVHEIGAYYRLTHGLNLDIEALYADYLKKKETDKKSIRKKFKKLEEMKPLPEGFSLGRDYSETGQGGTPAAGLDQLLPDDREELAEIEKMWERSVVVSDDDEDVEEGDPGYFASQNSGMARKEILQNSGMAGEEILQNSGQQHVAIPEFAQSEYPGSIFANIKKLGVIASVAILILRVMAVPFVRLNPVPARIVKKRTGRAPLEYRIKEAVRPVTDFLVKGLSAHGPTDVIKIEPKGTFSIEHKVEITAYNALYDVPSQALVSDYYLVFIFEEGLSPGTRLQIFLKNRGWKDLYAYPASPTGGNVIFRPGMDSCNVCKFKPEETPYGDISAIGVKVWDGAPDNAKNNLKTVYVIKNGIKLEDVLEPKKTAPTQKKDKSVQEIPPAPFFKGGEEKLSAPPAAIPQPQPKKQKSSDPDTIEVPLDIPGTWYGQKWPDSQAISNVRYDPKRKALVGDFNIIQGHPNLDRGEVIVDVLELGIAPFNFDKYELTGDVKVIVEEEGSFGHTPNNADGVGFFVKTGPAQSWKNVYEWENHPKNEVGEWKSISFNRGEFNKIDRVDIQDGFPLKDPIIRMFGIKLGAGKDRTGSKFTKAKGEILVRNVRISPRVEKYAPPDFWPKVPEARKKVPGEIKIPITTNWPVREDAGNWAVKATHAKGGILALTVKLRGGDPEGDHNKGETYLPLYDKKGKRVVSVPGLPEEGYFSGKGKVIKSLVWAPKSYAEGKKIPSAIQSGAHDKHYNYQNNAWNPSLITKDLTGKWHELKFYPMDPAENEPGYTDDDFQVISINELLYKTGLPGAAFPDYKWDGHIYITDIRIEPDDRVFPEPVPPLIKTKMYAENPRDKLPVPIELFEMLSGGGGYGLFDFDLTPEGLLALEEKIKNMPPDAHVWRHMALFGSLSPNGPILFDENDNFIGFGFIDPVTGKKEVIGIDGMKKRVDAIFSMLKRYNKKAIVVLIAHDAADGKKKKENRIEGDRPGLFTDSKKFRKFLLGIKPILEHIRDQWRAPASENADLDLIQHNFNNPKTVVAMLELFNEPLNMDTAQVPVPFIQRRIHEFFELVYGIDSTLLLSTGMRDYESLEHFAHHMLPEYLDGTRVVKNPFYKNVVPSDHWYGDKESVTPLETNIGKFFMPDHVLFWLKGELDPRTSEEYKAAIGIIEVMRKVYIAGNGGGLFWVDDEFLPNWADFQRFFKDNTAQIPFTPPTPAKPVQIAITPEVLRTLPDTMKAIKEGRFIYKDVNIFAESEYPITFKMLTEKDVNIKLARMGLRTEIIEALTGLADSVILRGYPLNYETITRALEEIITLQAAKELIPHARTLRDRGIPVTRKTLSRAFKKQKKIKLTMVKPGARHDKSSSRRTGFSQNAQFAMNRFKHQAGIHFKKHKKLIMSLAAMLTMAPAIAGAWEPGMVVSEASRANTISGAGLPGFASILFILGAIGLGLLMYKLRAKALRKQAGNFQEEGGVKTRWLFAAILFLFIFGMILVKNIGFRKTPETEKSEIIQVEKSKEQTSVDFDEIVRRAKRGNHRISEPSSPKNIQLPEAMREFEGLRFLYESSDGRTEFYESPDEKFEKIEFYYNRDDTIYKIVGYDAEGNDYTICVCGASGSCEKYSYTDSLKEDMLYDYDPNDELTRQIKYNDDGEWDWRENRENGVWYHYAYEYDSGGGLERKTKWGPNDTIPKVWEYDPNTSHLSREINSDKSSIEYEYSAGSDDSEKWRPSWPQFEWHYDPNGGLVKTVEYDSTGNIVDITDSDGNPAQMIRNAADDSYYFYTMENGDRAEYHYSSDGEFFKEVRYDGSRIWRIIERVSPNEEKDTHIWKDNTYNTRYYEMDEDGNFIKISRIEYFNSEGQLTKKINDETQEYNAFEYPPDKPYFIENCYDDELFDTLIKSIRHPYPENENSGVYDSGVMNFSAKRVFSPTRAGSAAAGAILLFPTIANAWGGRLSSAAALPISTVLMRILSHPLGAGIAGAIAGLILYLVIDQIAAKIQEMPASPTNFADNIRLTRLSFIKGTIGGVLLFLWWLSNPFRANAFIFGKKDSLLETFKISSDEKPLQTIKLGKNEKILMIGNMLFAENGNLIGTILTAEVLKIVSIHTDQIIGYFAAGFSSLDNTAGKHVAFMRENNLIKSKATNKIVGKTSHSFGGSFYNKKGRVVAVSESAGANYMFKDGKKFLLTESEHYLPKESLVPKFFEEYSLSVQNKILAQLSSEDKNWFSIFVKHVVLILRKWHLREHNPMGIDELRELIKADGRSSAVLANIILMPELFGDLFNLTFNAIEKKSLKSGKNIYDFLKEDAELSDNEILKYVGVVAVFGGFKQICKNHPELFSGLPERIFTSEKEIRELSYFIEQVYYFALIQDSLHKVFFEKSLIKFYQSLPDTDKRKCLVEITSSILGDNLSPNTKNALKFKPVDNKAYRQIQRNKLIHKNTLIIKNYFYNGDWYNYAMQVAPAFGYPEKQIEKKGNAFLATQEINGITVKFIGILNAAIKEEGDPFAELKADILVHRGHQGGETGRTFNGREKQASLLLPLGCRSAGDADWIIAGKYPEAIMWGTGGTGEGLKNTPFVFHLIEAVCNKEYTTWKQVYSYLEQRLGKGVARNYMRPDSLTFVLIKELKKRYPDAVKNYNFQRTETVPVRAGPRQDRNIFASQSGCTRREILQSSFRLPIIGVVLSGVKKLILSLKELSNKDDNQNDRPEPSEKKPLRIRRTVESLILFLIAICMLGAERNLGSVACLAWGVLFGCCFIFFGRVCIKIVCPLVLAVQLDKGVSVVTIKNTWEFLMKAVAIVVPVMSSIVCCALYLKICPGDNINIWVLGAVIMSILSGYFLSDSQMMRKILSLTGDKAKEIFEKFNESATKSGFTKTLGVSFETYKKLVAKDAISELCKRGIDRVVSLDESGDREAMMRELSEKTKGEKVICMLLDETTFGQLDLKNSRGDINMKKFMNTVNLFVERAQKDIFPLMRPRLARLNAETVNKINDASKLKGVLNIYARTLREVESFELADKSIYDERLADLQSMLFSKVVMSKGTEQFVKEAIGNFSKDDMRYISVSAQTAADMRFIAGALDKMGMNKQKASSFIQVRVCNKNVTDKNLDKYLERTGLGAYLARENVKVVSSADELGLEETIEVVKETFGQGINTGHIFIGDSRDITQGDKATLKEKNAPVYVQMQGEGIASQLLRAMIELAALGDQRKSRMKIKGLGIICRKDGYYVFLPDIKPVIDLLREEIKNYETICSMV